MTLLDTARLHVEAAVSEAPGDEARVMSDGVAIPAWLLVVMAALAVWALYEHAVVPALRFW